jgi:hypothetical protein
MVTYKVSYVVVNEGHPGMILNQDCQPQKGERIDFNGTLFEVLEVLELAPPRGDFRYIHVTCRLIQPAEKRPFLSR